MISQAAWHRGGRLAFRDGGRGEAHVCLQTVLASVLSELDLATERCENSVPIIGVCGCVGVRYLEAGTLYAVPLTCRVRFSLLLSNFSEEPGCAARRRVF